ncbi:MAG: 2Fe-2S iron-sulfur cluster-binding protein [Microthrixaceae bacterium]
MDHVHVDGSEVQVEEGAGTLLDLLREQGCTAVKDGCSPQGQCGCCTVLVDGAPRVACVTPARRVVGRRVVTFDGLDDEVRDRWTAAVLATGASQCGFCTPGIVVRLEGARSAGKDLTDRAVVDRALAAHLCRCTGWATLEEAAAQVAAGTPVALRSGPELEAAGRRASLELGAPQHAGPDVVAGRAGFSVDTVPPGALVAVPDPSWSGADVTDPAGWVVADTVAAARALAGKVQGRRTTLTAGPPLELPSGDWAASLRTSWVDPAYLETDASWCEPGGEPSSPAANGGAFGAKRHSPVPAAARRLAGHHGRPVLAVWSREDVVRLGAKRPPVAGGVLPDGTGVLRVVRTAGVADAVAAVAPGLVVEEVDLPGPPTSAAVRAAGWAEAAVLLAGAGASSPTVVLGHDGAVTVAPPGRGAATVRLAGDGTVEVLVDAGDPLDAVTLRSYCVGAVHMALGWVRSESLAVDTEGVVHDLTIRSFGVLRAADMPQVQVVLDGPGTGSGEPRPVADSVFAATAAALWLALGTPRDWPTGSSPGPAV